MIYFAIFLHINAMFAAWFMTTEEDLRWQELEYPKISRAIMIVFLPWAYLCTCFFEAIRMKP